ncbi:alpha,alpha-phosphotrehalase [Cetobacterium sp. ZWU0022]|uniref:alpha,alpha-phosphotrehalase n=1 Tax=Cetobacterium sp. ZWU0022 TaxID=1340502 RepID=UPI000647FF8C|nr:alpha,alpha-phosphotrehalase [Cetobacterium sp. ZWU0022]
MLKKDWWKSSSVYQIYPKSFCDSNGDGIGDIKGIISKLDYIKSLGVDVIWTTPMYVSPMMDNGYDIADYYNIDPIFGDMEDFEELLDETHKRGMKLIMDMVINHTSTQNFWFKEALKGPENRYHNYYIWKDGEQNTPPTNWNSKFGGNAWEFVESLNKYYLHLFDVTQADLNWENPELRKDIYKMINFWLEKGVDGFRLDVINLISKEQNFLNDDYKTATSDGRKFYTDGPRVHEFLKELTANTFGKYPGSLTVGEMSSTTIPHCIEYTKPENEELSMVFNFHHLKVDYPNGDKWDLGKMDFAALKELLFKWQLEMQKGDGWSAVFWCNHDQPRIVSRFGSEKYLKESAKMLATAIHMLRGTPYIYQGEEIGMTNPHFETIEEYRDVESLNNYKILLQKGKTVEEAIAVLDQKSRDNSRTPVQWNNSVNAGFSKGASWIGISKNYEDINVENSLNDLDSVFYYYKKLIELRKNYKVVSHGTFTPMYENNSKIFGYTRQLNNEKLLVVNNFYEDEIDIEIPEEFIGKKVLIGNYNEIILNNKILILRAYESIVILSKA